MDADLSPLYAAIRTVPDFPKPGILFKDITPLLASPTLTHSAVDALAAPFLDAGITKIVGIEARGFILACQLAARLGAGFVPMRKQGKLPSAVLRQTYTLEYGTDTLEMHADALTAQDRVLIHDDVLATGGTAQAAAHLVAQTQASLAGFAFLAELGSLEGRPVLEILAPVHAVLNF